MAKANLAPSTAFGLWVGDRTWTTPADGKLVIGGYDSSRLEAGSNHSFPIANVTDQVPCPLQVNVTQITFGRGVDEQSLFGQDGGSFTACIDSSSDVFVFPPEVALKLGTITNANSTPSTKTFWYSKNFAPTNQIRVILDDGYSTTFYPDDYVQPYRTSDQSGHLNVYNESLRNLNILDNANDDAAGVQPQLGTVWLKKNYLIVDYEKNEFQIARALQGPATAAEDLVSLCTQTANPASSSSSSPHQKTTDSVSPTPPNSTNSDSRSSDSHPSPKKSNHTSAIVGGVVGGAAGLALMACLLFWLLALRRRQRQRQRQIDGVKHLPSPPPLPAV